MKVLFITNIPSPYRVDFFNELGKICDLTVSFEGKKATDRNKNWLGSQAIFFKSVYLNGIRTGSDNFFCPSIIKLIKQGWDKIIVGMYSTPTGMLAIQYMKSHKIKFYLESDGGFIKDENKMKFKLKSYFISSANYWFSSSDATTDYLTFYGASNERCFKYPFTSLLKGDFEHAEKISSIGKHKLKEKLNMKEDFIVLSVGRFTYEAGYGKGYDTILEAAEMMEKKIGFYIVGDEPTEEFVKWKREKNLTNVYFVGFKTKEELSYYYAAADIFVLMTRSDVWGLVINEAMMYGLPIITTDKCIAGTELVFNGENGYILPVGDKEKLKRCLEKLTMDRESISSFGLRSKKIITEYTVENMAKKHLKILNDY